MHLILLASGLGKRLGKFTSLKPKGAVIVNKKPIICYNFEFYKKFKNRVAIIGYKKNIIKKILKNEKFEFIENKKFRSTNMVESMFCCSKIINDDVVICYSDIIFDKNIYNNLVSKNNILPVYVNWLKFWKKRMNKKEILQDAEDIRINNYNLVSIGNKIERKFPRVQFMGIIKVNKNDYFKMYKFYKKIKNRKIDLTSFLNLVIKNNVAEIKISKTSKFWYEVDTIKDLRLVNNLII